VETISSNCDFIDSSNTTGGETYLDWASTVITYYFSVEGVTVDKDAPYEITVIRFDEPPPAPNWDACEINDDRYGNWSPDTPPGGPCVLSVDVKKTDLNFMPHTSALSPTVPNDDYFVFLAREGHRYRITTYMHGGTDTEMWLYKPDGTETYDNDGGDDFGSRIEETLSEGRHVILVRDKLRSKSPTTLQTYDLLVEDLTPATSTPTPAPGTVTATPLPPPPVPGQPDAYEPNYWFDRATLIGLGTKYTNLNFVPWAGSDPADTDFFKLWVVAGKLYTCETDDLGSATNTNIIFCSGPTWEQCFAGNDDVEPFDPDEPYRSRLTFFSSFDGYLYLVIGQVGAAQILPEEWKNLSYSLSCYIGQPGTATPTPTSEYVPPLPQPTSTPVLDTPVPSPTPVRLVVRPMTTPMPPPMPTPAATATPELYVSEMSFYYDQNGNGQADPGEGISSVLARAYDAISGELLSIDYTDEAGYLRFTVPARGPVRVSVPFFGFNQIVTEADTDIQIRISPHP
jgi:hypothetical protein